MIKVLAAANNSPLNAAQLDLLSYSLPPSVIHFSGKYKRWQDRQAFLLGRYLLLQCLTNYGYEKDILQDIKYTAYNRPYLPIPFDFNIAHSGSYVLCAISDHKVGIDIELVRPLEINDFTDYFSARDLLKINGAPDKYNEFFKYWTIKEAAIKADGQGMSIPLETILVSDQVRIDGNTWFIHKIDIDACYQSYLATNTPLGQLITIERVSIVLP